MVALRVGLAAALACRGVLADYDESRALEYGNFAAAAYCSQKSLERWSCGHKCSANVSDVTVCNGNHVKSYVAKWEGKCLVSFEGTNDIESFIADLKLVQTGTPWSVCGGCMVHSGFLEEYNSVKTCVQTALKGTGCPVGSPIRTTGHSLGASMNSIAMMDLTDAGWEIEESYDFGKPRTGDSKFAAVHNKLFKDKAWRVTHGKDPVPQVPPDYLIVDWRYEHVEPEIYYAGSVKHGYEECFRAHDDTRCAEQYWNVPLDLLHLQDHLDYMGTQTTTTGCENHADEDLVV